MAHLSASTESNQPNDARGTDTGASPIRVPASAQQDPGALKRCPVCGRPYRAEGQPVDTTQPEAASACANAPEPLPEPSRERRVIRCAACGSYSVGTLDAPQEE